MLQSRTYPEKRSKQIAEQTTKFSGGWQSVVGFSGQRKFWTPSAAGAETMYHAPSAAALNFILRLRRIALLRFKE